MDGKEGFRFLLFMDTKFLALPFGTKLGTYMVLDARSVEEDHIEYDAVHRKTGEKLLLWEYAGEGLSFRDEKGLDVEVVPGEESAYDYAQSAFLERVPPGDLDRFSALNTQFVIYPQGHAQIHDQGLAQGFPQEGASLHEENRAKDDSSDEVESSDIPLENAEGSEDPKNFEKAESAESPESPGENAKSATSSESAQALGDTPFSSLYESKESPLKKWLNRVAVILSLLLLTWGAYHVYQAIGEGSFTKEQKEEQAKETERLRLEREAALKAQRDASSEGDSASSAVAEDSSDADSVSKEKGDKEGEEQDVRQEKDGDSAMDDSSDEQGATDDVDSDKDADKDGTDEGSGDTSSADDSSSSSEPEDGKSLVHYDLITIPKGWPDVMPIKQEKAMIKIPHKMGRSSGVKIRSDHFEIICPTKLDEAAEKRVINVYEGTWQALLMIPIEFSLVRERSAKKFTEQLVTTQKQFLDVGGPPRFVNRPGICMGSQTIAYYSALGLDNDGKITGPTGSGSVVAHELTHQLTGPDCKSTWITEGLALYIDSIPMDEENVYFGKVIENLRGVRLAPGEVRYSLKVPWKLKEFLTIDGETFQNYTEIGLPTYDLSKHLFIFFLHLDGERGVEILRKYMKSGNMNDLVRGRTWDKLEKAIVDQWAQLGVEVVFKEKRNRAQDNRDIRDALKNIDKDARKVRRSRE